MMKIYTTVLLFCVLFLFGQKPISKFSASYSSSGSSNVVSFLSESTNDPTTYFWEFPGGLPATSTSGSPVITYSSPGTYIAKLTVSNASGSSLSTRTFKIASGNSSKIFLNTGYDNTTSALLGDIGVSDPDWTYTDPNNITSTPVTRFMASGWSFAQITTALLESRWITGNNTITGNHYYVSKSFDIPSNVTTAVLNLRCLSFIRSWTYLVKVNPDNTTTETQITNTLGTTNGWLNSQNPLVSNYPLEAGAKYFIKVKAYTNTAGQRQAVDVNAQVDLGSSFTLSPRAEFSASSFVASNGNPIQFKNLSAGTPISYSWNFQDGANVISSNLANPSVTFSNKGFHTSELIADYGNGMQSSLKINDYVETVAKPDYTLAPNSYIFYKDGLLPSGEKVDGLYIPIEKAFSMWDANGYLNNSNILNNTLTAKVLWEDVSGLIKTLDPNDYNLNLELNSTDVKLSKIKVVIDKSKGEGNAVIGLVSGNNLSPAKDNVVWSWHVWVTDNPASQTTSYGHSGGGATQLEFVGGQGSDNDIIPFTPKYMDRNLGAVSSKFLGDDWHKSGGLMYQWGRKDPLPPLVYKDGTFYEISGALGTYRHRNSSYIGNAISYATYFYDRPMSKTMLDNIRYSVNNPLKPVYNTVDASSKTWFNGSSTSNLWSDNSKGINDAHPELYSRRKGYKTKSSYDPCPNGWRIPSDLSANGDKMNFSPWGVDYEITTSDFVSGKYNILKPMGSSAYTNGLKVYPSLGMDLSNVNGKNMGVFPGSGKINLYSGGVFSPTFQDVHETVLWSATMHSNPNTPFARFTSLIPDPGQNGQPDLINYPTLKGLYSYNPSVATTHTMAPGGCRCMEDPLAENYDFQTQYFSLDENDSQYYKTYIEGLDNPNSYLLTKSNQDRILEIPISKAFSVHNQYMNDQNLSVDNLKVNVFWTTNPSLVSNLQIVDPPTSLANVKDGKIWVVIPKDQSGNALISLHKGSVNNPVYWSWHLWVSNTTPSSVTYTTENVLLPNENYVNWTNSGVPPLTTEFMDRNLGAIDALPSIAGISPENDVNMMAAIRNSGGMQYQWGRKDPIPAFRSPGYNGNNGAYVPTAVNIPIFRNESGPDTMGNLPPTSYTTLISSEENYATSIYSKAYSVVASSNTNKSIKIKENLEYAIKNPLTFIYQDQNSSIYGNDWLSNEPNAMSDRWGHGTKKSPFDPCPSGWRVPDMESVNNGFDKGTLDINGDPLVLYTKGNSPWYNGYFKNSNADIYTYYSLGIRETLKKPVSSDPATTVPFYYGKAIRSQSVNNRYGLQFDNAEIMGNPNTKYRIGNYPFTGIRGFYPTALGPAAIAYGYIGSWTASLNSNFQGFATGLYIGRVYEMVTGYAYSPALAMNVRCVKHNDIYRGSIPETPNVKIIVIANKAKSYASEKEMLEFYPNPVNDILSINKDGVFQYDIYDTSGKLVRSGTFENKKTSLSSLSMGIYFIRINGFETIAKIIKN